MGSITVDMINRIIAQNNKLQDDCNKLLKQKTIDCAAWFVHFYIKNYMKSKKV